MCNECYKLLKMEDIREVISPKIYIFYTENQEYRVCTNIDIYFEERIFSEENVKGRIGKVSRETLGIYLNSKTSEDIKESSWVALYLGCPTKSLYSE